MKASRTSPMIVTRTEHITTKLAGPFQYHGFLGSKMSMGRDRCTRVDLDEPC
jgi:hypothetical protein